MADLIWGALTTKWPKPETPAYDRKRTDWQTGGGRPQRKLNAELDQLQVREARIEVDAVAADFRKLDGALYKDAKLRSPRVLVVFHLPEIGEVQYACDQFYDWQENLHAIALTLERLRLVDGYGATAVGARQQYRGFKRIGSGGEEVSQDEVLDPTEAASRILRFGMPDPSPELVAALVPLVLNDAEQMRLYVRKAERNTHPDSGGSSANFDSVQRCKAVLQVHHQQ